jgi:hypothetical protein
VPGMKKGTKRGAKREQKGSKKGDCEQPYCTSTTSPEPLFGRGRRLRQGRSSRAPYIAGRVHSSIDQLSAAFGTVLAATEVSGKWCKSSLQWRWF